MKLSELKKIIIECVEELSEGPARDYRKKHGFQYKSFGRDELKHRELNSKRSEDGWEGSGRFSKRPLKDMVKSANNRKRIVKMRNGTIVHTKKAKGGSKESASKRQWNIDHEQYPRVTKKGKLPR